MKKFTDSQVVEMVDTLRLGWTKPSHTPSEFTVAADIIEALHAEVKELRELSKAPA